jgi:glycosyltransferase involved in cell wall biosynthesis
VNELKVAYFTQCFYPARGGMESYFLDLARYIAKENEVRVYTSSAMNADELRIVRLHSLMHLPYRTRYGNIRIIRSDITQLPISLGKQFSESFTMNYREKQQVQSGLSKEISFLFNWGFSSGMANHALHDDSDIFHVSSLPFLHNHVELAISRFRKKPCVFTPFFHHASDHEARVHALPFRLSDKIIAVTEFEKRKIHDLFKISNEKIEVIPIPIDLDSYIVRGTSITHPAYDLVKNIPKILFMGRLTYNKGLIFLVRTLKELWNRGNEISLIVIGKPTPEWNELKKTIGVHDHFVHHYQDISDSEKVYLLKMADILVVPSIVESFGIVFLEAWTQKKPVIGAQNMPYNEFIIDGKTGFNVPFNNIEVLSEKITTLIEDPGLSKRMGENGFKQLKEKFSCEIIYPRIHALYESLLHK